MENHESDHELNIDELNIHDIDELNEEQTQQLNLNIEELNIHDDELNVEQTQQLNLNIEELNIHDDDDELNIEDLLLPMTLQSYPWLLITDSQNEGKQIYYSTGRDSYDVCTMPAALDGTYISCCYDGLLVSVKYRYAYCQLFNLSTFGYYDLPDQVGYFNHTIVSSSKMDNTCRVVFIGVDSAEVESCHPGDSEVVKHKFFLDQAEVIHRFHIFAATNFEGKLYIMSGKYNLISADFADPDLHFTTVIQGSKLGINPIYDPTRMYLVESCGELLFIHIKSYNHEVVKINIFRAMFEGSRWDRVRSLGDRTIFLDDHKGLSSSYGASDLGLIPNSIYVVSSGDRNLYLYDLEDETITFTLPCPIVHATDVSLFWATIPDFTIPDFPYIV